MPIRIGFDIGGVISKYPSEFKSLMATLHASPLWEVFVVTDMPRDIAQAALDANDVRDYRTLLCADWTAHGDMCKSVLLEEHGITMMIDDRPDYVTEGVLIGLVVAPRPKLPYYSPGWVDRRK